MSKLTPTQINKEFSKLKIPKFIIFAEKLWFKFGSYFMFFGILSYLPLGIIINNSNNHQLQQLLFQLATYFFIFLFGGLGGIMLTSHLIEKAFVNKHSKRLGLTIDEWNMYASRFKLKSY